GGDTFEELIENAKEAIELYLETLKEEEKGAFYGRGCSRYRKPPSKISPLNPHKLISPSESRLESFVKKARTPS
ncbi:MAG: hypothetical protein ACP5K1_06275, partial [Candidatus Bathyarchaeia archaeon]